MSEKLPCKIYPRDMQLGDVVRLARSSEELFPWATAIVKQIVPDEAVGKVITLFRPYGTCADFSTTGGVICYIGIEEYVVHGTSGCAFTLLERKELK